MELGGRRHTRMPRAFVVDTVVSAIATIPPGINVPKGGWSLP